MENQPINTVEEHLPPYQVRPRFQVELPIEQEEIEQTLKSSLLKIDAKVIGRVNHGYATFYLPKIEQHYWSPGLTLSLENTDSGTLLRGMYGPRPAVWTMFIFFYALIAFAILVLSIIGLSNYSLGKAATILWLVPLLVLVFLSLYLVAYFGQKMGHDQMITLHRFLEESLGVEIV